MAAKKFSYAGVAGEMNTNMKTIVELQGELFEGMTLEVRHMIELEDYMSVVNGIAETVFDLETSEYKPELMDFATKLYVMRAYAGVSLPEKGLNKAYRVLVGTDLYEQVAAWIDETQLDKIVDAAYERVKYYRDAALSVASKQMNEMIAQMKDAAESANELSAQVQSDEFKEMLQKFVDANGADESAVSGNSNIVDIPKKAN